MSIEATSQITQNSDKVRVKKAAEIFGISEDHLRHMIMRREIPHYKLGGMVFLSVQEINAKIEEGRVTK